VYLRGRPGTGQGVEGGSSRFDDPIHERPSYRHWFSTTRDMKPSPRDWFSTTLYTKPSPRDWESLTLYTQPSLDTVNRRPCTRQMTLEVSFIGTDHPTDRPYPTEPTSPPALFVINFFRVFWFEGETRVRCLFVFFSVVTGSADIDMRSGSTRSTGSRSVVVGVVGVEGGGVNSFRQNTGFRRPDTSKTVP